MFKIDFIVWKYGDGQGEVIVNTSFKIDFIVWKCKTITSTAEGTFSLKQTLQYGNLPISCFKRLTMSV